MAPRDHSLILTARPSWREAGRLPMLATLSERADGLGSVDEYDVTAAGGTRCERVWASAEHILRDALEGGWLGSSVASGRVVALRYCGPAEGDDRREWVDATHDLNALVLVGALLGFLSGEDGDWPWASDLVGPALAEVSS